MSEHDFEPIRGLPGELPPGEKLLWQGAPDWFALAQRAFHLRSAAIYFAALIAWRASTDLAAGTPLTQALQSAALLLPVVVVALGLIAFLGWLTARTTVYTITSKRLVMRFGVAMPKAINIPFTIIENAALRSYSDKSGDIAVTLSAPNKIAYLMLWPHARPWKMSRAEPTLRAVGDGAEAARILADALRAAHGASAATASTSSIQPGLSPIPALATA